MSRSSCPKVQDAPASSETDRRRRRAGRTHGRAHARAARKREERDRRRQEGFRRLVERGRRRDLRGDRRRAGRLPHRAQRRGLVALPDHERLSVVQRRRPLEFRADQIVKTPRERHDRHRRRRARQVFRPCRLGRASVGHKDARRRGDERCVRRRLVGNGQRRHARQRGRDARQDGLRGGRRAETAHRLGLRRQGDDRACRRQNRALHRRRSCLRGQCRSLLDRRRLGAGRLRRGADPSPARHWREAHAGARDRRRLVRHRSRLAHPRCQARCAAARPAAPIHDSTHSSRGPCGQAKRRG